MNKSLAIVASSLALGACGGNPATERDAADSREAEGEVLGGTISDAMIPVERVRSQSSTLRSASPGESSSPVEETPAPVAAIEEEVSTPSQSTVGTDRAPAG